VARNQTQFPQVPAQQFGGPLGYEAMAGSMETKFSVSVRIPKFLGQGKNGVQRGFFLVECRIEGRELGYFGMKFQAFPNARQLHRVMEGRQGDTFLNFR
jgi:hypothetical protein